MLAKGFGQAVPEYKRISQALVDTGVLNKQHGALLRELAGYRNRLLHFYDEVTHQELYEICSQQVGDVDTVLDHLIAWNRSHPDKRDQAI